MNIYDLLAALSCIFVIAFLCDFYVVRTPFVGVDLATGKDRTVNFIFATGEKEPLRAGIDERRYAAIFNDAPEWRKVDEIWCGGEKIYKKRNTKTLEKFKATSEFRHRAKINGLRKNRYLTDMGMFWRDQGKPIRPLVRTMLDGYTSNDVTPEWRRTYVDALKQIIGEGRV